MKTQETAVTSEGNAPRETHHFGATGNVDFGAAEAYSRLYWKVAELSIQRDELLAACKAQAENYPQETVIAVYNAIANAERGQK